MVVVVIRCGGDGIEREETAAMAMGADVAAVTKHSGITSPVKHPSIFSCRLHAWRGIRGCLSWLLELQEVVQEVAVGLVGQGDNVDPYNLFRGKCLPERSSGEARCAITFPFFSPPSLRGDF